MGDYKRLLLLILIILGVVLAVAGTSIGVLYYAAVEREQMRLATIARSQARLIEALARLEAEEHSAAGGLDAANTVMQIIEAQRSLRELGMGTSGEITLARREGDNIVWLSRSRAAPDAPLLARPLSGTSGEPMQRALAGQSGTMIGKDYLDNTVVAAFEPVQGLGLGIVAKVDLWEINGRYLRAAAYAALVAAALAAAASFMFVRVGEPVIRRMRDSESRYRELFDNMLSGAAVYEPVAGGLDFVFKDLNRAGERLERLDRKSVIGRRLTDLYPNIREFGLPEVMARVWRSGKAESLPARRYRDDNREEWRENCVFRLPSGEVVALFADVSERRQAEEALRRSEERYRVLVERQPGLICQCEADGTLIFVNPAFARFYGSDAEELVGSRWADLMSPSEEADALGGLAKLTVERPMRQREQRSVAEDGSERWHLWHDHAFFDEAGVVRGYQSFGLDITEHKSAEDAIRESEARFRGTFENAAVGIAHVDIDGTWLRVNQRLCKIVGYDHDELLRQTFQQISHPADLQADLASFQALLRGEIATYAMEKRFFHKAGHVVWVNLTTGVQRDEAGRPLYAISIIEDISPRKRAELALRDGEFRMRALLDASQDEILLVSTEGVILAINEAARTRLARRTGGRDPQGARLGEVLPEHDAEQRFALVRKVADSGVLLHFDRQIRSRWFDFWYYPVVRSEGRIAEVAIYAREITEQRRSEAHLRTLFQAIEQSPVSVVITDCSGTIDYVNPKFAEATGYPAAEAIGRNPRILKSGHTSPDEYASLWRTISGGHVWRGEFLNRSRNGKLFWEVASIAPVKDAHGTITHYVAVKEDITERKEMEEQLRQSQKMQALGQLTGGIAHDFNNLLAIILGNLQLLQERLADDARLKDLLDDAVWSARRGAELTHRLLAFARRQPLRPDVVDLNAIIDGMSSLLRRTLGAGIEIREQLAEASWPAYADRGELERALLNLAVNARDAMQGSGTLTLETRDVHLDAAYAEQFEELTPGDYVMLMVSDTGTGMSPEVLRRVFEPFFTTKEVGKGSGLGLSMVYGFVKQSGGHVNIYSRPGRGTSVRMYLPRAGAAAAAAEEVRDALGAECLRNRTILLVEDEAKLRKVAVRMLDGLGVTLLQAETGYEALRTLEQHKVDVLFTDVELPGGMNGPDLAMRVRTLHPGIKVLFTTGYARGAPGANGSADEMAPWLLKPYARADLVRALAGVLAA